MTKQQTPVRFTINGLQYKAEVISVNPGEILGIGKALERIASTAMAFNQEDADNICAHAAQIPTELRENLLVTHHPHPNSEGHYLFIRVRQDGSVMQDWADRNRQCSPRYVRVLTRD